MKLVHELRWLLTAAWLADAVVLIRARTVHGRLQWVQLGATYAELLVIGSITIWPRGPMDKASAYGAGDCRFESCRGHLTVPYRQQ